MGCPRDMEMHTRDNDGKQRTDIGDNQERRQQLTKLEISCNKQPYVSWGLKEQEREELTVDTTF